MQENNVPSPKNNAAEAYAGLLGRLAVDTLTQELVSIGSVTR